MYPYKNSPTFYLCWTKKKWALTRRENLPGGVGDWSNHQRNTVSWMNDSITQQTELGPPPTGFQAGVLDNGERVNAGRRVHGNISRPFPRSFQSHHFCCLCPPTFRRKSALKFVPAGGSVIPWYWLQYTVYTLHIHYSYATHMTVRLGFQSLELNKLKQISPFV